MLTLEELAILAAVNDSMYALEIVNKVSFMYKNPKFDKSVTLAMLPGLVREGFLRRLATNGYGPTVKGLEAAQETLRGIRTIEDGVRNIHVRQQ